MAGFNGIVDSIKEEELQMMNGKFQEENNVWVLQVDGEHNYITNVLELIQLLMILL
jgi:hypothetical protein